MGRQKKVTDLIRRSVQFLLGFDVEDYHPIFQKFSTHDPKRQLIQDFLTSLLVIVIAGLATMMTLRAATPGLATFIYLATFMYVMLATAGVLALFTTLLAIRHQSKVRHLVKNINLAFTKALDSSPLNPQSSPNTESNE